MWARFTRATSVGSPSSFPSTEVESLHKTAAFNK